MDFQCSMPLVPYQGDTSCLDAKCDIFLQLIQLAPKICGSLIVFSYFIVNSFCLASLLILYLTRHEVIDSQGYLFDALEELTAPFSVVRSLVQFKSTDLPL